MQFKLFSRNALRLGAFLLTISLAACTDPPAQPPVEEDPGRPTNSVLPKNMTDQPKDFNDYGYNKDAVELCEYVNQKCKVERPTNSAKWLGCVNVDPNTPKVGVCRTLCSDTMRCSSNLDSCVPWKSPAATEPSKVPYTGYCTSSGSECKGYFDTKSCGDKKRCVADPKIPKRFICADAGTTALGAACTKTSDCKADAVCAEDLEGNNICTKICLTNEKVLDIVGGTAAETAELRAPYLCESGTTCLFSERSDVLATGIGLCMDPTNVCQPGQLKCTTQGNEHGVCVTTQAGTFCKHFEGEGNEKVGSKGMFEICNTANPCSAGLVCASINNDGQKYCVQPCENASSCETLGKEKRDPGKNSSYVCVNGLVPGSAPSTAAVPSVGYCLLNCAADQYGKKCKDGADTSLKSNAVCTISEFNQNRDYNLRVYSGNFCLERPDTKTIGDDCDPKTDFCGEGNICAKANPSAAKTTCVAKVVCQSDADCAAGKRCNFGTFTANTEKGNKLGICRKPCTPDADYLDKNGDCDLDEKRCVQVGLDNDGKQFTFCSDSTGKEAAGQACKLDRMDQNFVPVVNVKDPYPVFTSHPIEDPCAPSLTCATGTDLGAGSHNEGTCAKRCHLTIGPNPTSSGCGADEVCGFSAIGNLLEHGSPVGVPFLSPICFKANTKLIDKKHGAACTKTDVGKPCAPGTTCREFTANDYRCLDLCQEDSDCAHPSSYDGKVSCFKLGRFNLSSKYGVCINFNFK